MTNFISTLINSNPFLSNEEIRMLCYKMHNSNDQKERIESRNKLALSFSQYAYGICNQQFMKGKISEEGIEDMFNDILEVILEKAWEYNPDNATGACFITFIAPYVKNTALKTFNGEKTEYYVRTMNRINKAIASYVEVYNEKPSIEELSELTGLSVKVIKNAYALRESYMTVSIYDSVGSEDNGLTYGDIAIGSATIHANLMTPEEAVYEEAMNNKLHLGIQELSFIERFAVENFQLSERKAVQVLENEYGIVMGRTTYQNYKNKAVRKLRNFLNNDHMELLAA